MTAIFSLDHSSKIKDIKQKSTSVAIINKRNSHDKIEESVTHTTHNEKVTNMDGVRANVYVLHQE